MNVSVLGCGRWGSFLAWYAARVGHEVVLWGRESSLNLARFQAERRNEYLTLPPNVRLSDNLEEALAHAEIVLLSIGAQEVRSFAAQLVKQKNWRGQTVVLCMKGLESDSGKRLSQVFAEESGRSDNLAVWLGPGHVQDFVAGIPNCMVIDSLQEHLTRQIVAAFHSPLIRFYYGQDLLGCEIGAAAKNVMGLAAGMLDALGYGSLKGSLMARGAREVSRLTVALGGNALTAYGLSHLGDYEATLFSAHSHNRKYGESFVRKEAFGKLAEGAATAVALREIGCRVEMPISQAVYEILFDAKAAPEKLVDLFLRMPTTEF
ncbi:NAD(P)H-dependent glycerol-3-phosphate dehydrogenase [Azotosporobacter soli]|uniref:NAD(P)H-dependent glycerol-3-phosphate dehydrogenase n=1 Tax=Azotosporobacter soli TaxID=3055040 RepID=UPI003D1614E8